MIEEFRNTKSCKIRKFAQFIGNLMAAVPAIKYSQLYTKLFERHKFLALLINDNNYESHMSISGDLQEDFTWWTANIVS